MSQKFPPPNFLNFNAPGRGVGRGHRRGSAALPNAPKRRVVAARRASSLGVGGVRGSNRWRLSRFSPHILYERLLTQSKYQPQVQNTHSPKQFSAISRFFLLRPEAQKKTDCRGRAYRGSAYRGQSTKKKMPGSFAACGRRHGASPPDLPACGRTPFEKGGRKLKRGTAETLEKDREIFGGAASFPKLFPKKFSMSPSAPLHLSKNSV